MTEPAIRRDGRRWAEMASRWALAAADQPSVQTIQVCEILGAYWFLVGERERAFVHTS